MPSCERFSALCHLHFGPAVHTNRLAKLARLLFTSGIHDLPGALQRVGVPHGRSLASAKGGLFIGGLPKHIKVDVELRCL